jgi:hypothetical protein
MSEKDNCYESTRRNSTVGRVRVAGSYMTPSGHCLIVGNWPLSTPNGRSQFRKTAFGVPKRVDRMKSPKAASHRRFSTPGTLGLHSSFKRAANSAPNRELGCELRFCNRVVGLLVWHLATATQCNYWVRVRFNIFRTTVIRGNAPVACTDPSEHFSSVTAVSINVGRQR